MLLPAVPSGVGQRGSQTPAVGKNESAVLRLGPGIHAAPLAALLYGLRNPPLWRPIPRNLHLDSAPLSLLVPRPLLGGHGRGNHLPKSKARRGRAPSSTSMLAIPVVTKASNRSSNGAEGLPT